jgi:hypothetical protein
MEDNEIKVENEKPENITKENKLKNIEELGIIKDKDNQIYELISSVFKDKSKKSEIIEN